MDSTTYDLLNPTLEYLNKQHNKHITPADIKDWHWDKTLGVNPYKFWDTEGTFRSLKPFPSAVEAIHKVHLWGIRQVFFSAVVSKYAAWEKVQAIERDFPFIGKKDLLMTGGNKDLVKGDVLVDDGPHNLEQFAGTTILANLYDAPYCQFIGANAILRTWEDYPRLVESFMNNKEHWIG